MTTPVDNILFCWTDEAGAQSYQCERDPVISWKYDDLAYTQELGNQLDVDDWIGQRVIFKLEWLGNQFIRGDQMYNLVKMRNAFTTITFFPAPNTNPSESYQVKIKPKHFDFDLVRGAKVFGYECTVILSGTEVLDELPLSAIMMCDL